MLGFGDSQSLKLNPDEQIQHIGTSQAGRGDLPECADLPLLAAV